MVQAGSSDDVTPADGPRISRVRVPKTVAVGVRVAHEQPIARMRLDVLEGTRVTTIIVPNVPRYGREAPKGIKATGPREQPKWPSA